MTRPRQGLLVVAHGTRCAAGAAECRALVDRLRALRPGLPVALGNLELAGPTLADGVDGLVADDARDLTAVPLMLGRARHAKQDIPAAIDDERRRHPSVQIALGQPLGISSELLDLLDERVRTVADPECLSETAVVLARAGSSDPGARVQIARSARLLEARGPYRLVRPAFAGIAEPSVEQSLRHCYQRGARRLVVVPHLLFEGDLSRRVRRQAEQFGAAHADADLGVAAHLGPDRRIARLVLQRHEEALRLRPAA